MEYLVIHVPVCFLQVIHNVHIEPAHIMKKRSLDQQLRISLHYDVSVSALERAKQDLVRVSNVDLNFTWFTLLSNSLGHTMIYKA